MKTLNKVMLLGSVGKDPELRSTGGGTLVAKISLATNTRYRDSSGNWAEKTQWHKLTAWGKMAEIVRDYVRKGDPLHIEGEIEYTERDGKWYTDIRVNDLILLGSKEKRQNPAPTAQEMGFQQEDDSLEVPF